jgi:ABC-type nitrate/sulfonate/bicarbonate transport system substrate-binding protein
MPDGAPALALAKLMHEDAEDDGVTYKVVDTSLISSVVTNADEAKNADMCVLPVTAASKLLGKGDRYKMVGVVTHGNLFLISKDGEALTAENLSNLQGKTVGVLKINEVPGLTLKAILNKYDIPFEEVKTV